MCDCCGVDSVWILGVRFEKFLIFKYFDLDMKKIIASFSLFALLMIPSSCAAKKDAATEGAQKSISNEAVEGNGQASEASGEVLPEVTMADVWAAYEGFNNVYLDPEKYIYKNTDRDKHARGRDKGAAAIWCQPMYVDMALDAAALAKSTGDKELAEQYATHLDKLIEGNISHYVDFNFDICDLDRGWFIYDDIQWWTITMARAYLATGVERYRELAEKSFARVWYGSPIVGDTGSYADPEKGLGGGMFWQWQPLFNPNPNRAGDGKMSCINFPTALAAVLLYECAPADRQADTEPIEWVNLYGEFSRPNYETKARYLEMAREIFDWAIENLAQVEGENAGIVFDNRHGDRIGGGPLIYNQGTMIGSGALLYLATGEQRYLKAAVAGAEFSINVMSARHGVLPWAHNHRNPYSQGSLEQGVYPAIWAQGMKVLVERCGQEQFVPFIQNNIKVGWNNRDKERNICDGRSWRPTSTHHMIGSYSASSIPALMLAFPPTGK